jgi:hypothetical protein
MRCHQWRSIQQGLPKSAHGSSELVKQALLVEVDGMSRNTLHSSVDEGARDGALGEVDEAAARAGRIRVGRPCHRRREVGRQQHLPRAHAESRAARTAQQGQ